MKPLAKAFAAAGFAVELPLLPGHGTHVSDMNATSWQDWSEVIDKAYVDLASRCDRVVVAGLSMGGALTAWLASRHPEILGIIVVNPLIDPTAPLWAALTAAGEAADGEYLPEVGSDIALPGVVESAYDAVPIAPLRSLNEALAGLVQALPQITSPALVFVSPQDHVVDPASSQLLVARSSGEATLVELPNSYHVATLDYESDLINERSAAWATELCRQNRQTAG
nr:alpha/beta fold hydrolase [Streptomyces sp. HM190]